MRRGPFILGRIAQTGRTRARASWTRMLRLRDSDLSRTTQQMRSGRGNLNPDLPPNPSLLLPCPKCGRSTHLCSR